MGEAILFDTHLYVKKLKAVGFSEEQAETLASTQAELINERLATRQGLKELETSLKRDIKELETSLKRDIKELETSLKRDIKELELRLEAKISDAKAEIIKWNVGAVFAAVGIFATLTKLIG